MNLSEKRYNIYARWGMLFLSVFVIWVFAFALGPILRDNIPVLKRFAIAIEEKDIDAGAYFYTETKETDKAEHYLRVSVKSSPAAGGPERGMLPTLAGVGLCIAVLWAGSRFLF